MIDPTGGEHFRARREVGLALACYGAYLVVRRVVWNERGRTRAHDNAERIAAFEQRAHFDVEAAVQRSALKVRGAVPLLNAIYAAGNVALSVGWLMLLFHRRDARYQRERTAAIVAFLGALPGFAFVPTAPPRVLGGFVNVASPRGGGLDDPRLQRFYNPIAAMPSHHVAFAIVTGGGIASGRRAGIGRATALTYPAAVAAVVVATANHFVVDVLAGAALGVIARRVTR
jgi:membrane-associated phospholipid phosphatase